MKLYERNFVVMSFDKLTFDEMTFDQILFCKMTSDEF